MSSVSGVGPFVRGEVALSTRLLASAGVRSDAVQFRLRDRLISATNPDDSGERTLHAVSPAGGLVWRATPLASIYGNVSSSFETPTTTELGNKEDGSAGINPELQPQRTVTFELGTKGLFAGTGVRWDVAAFEAHARDELVPFDIPNGNGRRFFRNAGRTLRRGGEVGLDAESGPFAVHAAYEYSHFRYVELRRRHDVVCGKAHSRSARARAHDGRLVARRRNDAVGDGRSRDHDGRRRCEHGTRAGPAIFGVSIGHDVRVGGAKLAPLVAVQNLGGVRYVGSVSVNAAAGKFYEPAPGRVLLVRFALSRDR